MTINIVTDEETDRMMSLRASAQVPLPREIALCEPRDARAYFHWLTFYEILGVSEHPLVELLSRRRLDAAMASSVSRAEHLDRVAHYAAWLGKDTVLIEDLTAPTSDDPSGDCPQAPSGADAVPPLSPTSLRPEGGPVFLSPTDASGGAEGE